jgi:ABC-2 type transport system ATP-binding protein
MASVLEIKDLHKWYHKHHALRGITLELPGAGINGFLGPNGAGKTTTIKLIAGLLRPASGCVRINGTDITADTIRARRCTGVMMETPHFYGYLSGKDNLQVLTLLSGRCDGQRISNLLDRVGLNAKAKEKVSTYSRGMRQRLGLAAALLGDPQLVILDEPTNGLDPEGIARMREWLGQMAREENRTVLLSSHQMGEMERVCDSFTIIDQGRIVASGSAADLARPRPSIAVRVRDPKAAESALREMGGSGDVKVLGADQVLVDAPGVSPAEVNRFLVNRGIDVIEISEQKESLEEIFFRLVGRNSDVA